MFVIGDSGQAAMFDIRLKRGNQLMHILQRAIAEKAKRSPVYTEGKIKDYKWIQLCPWVRIHNCGKADENYVHSVTFAEDSNIFVSATSHGEIKLWQNSEQVVALGTINSNNWNNQKLLNFISKTIHYSKDEKLAKYLEQNSNS